MISLSQSSTATVCYMAMHSSNATAALSQPVPLRLIESIRWTSTEPGTQYVWQG